MAKQTLTQMQSVSVPAVKKRKRNLVPSSDCNLKPKNPSNRSGLEPKNPVISNINMESEDARRG